MTVSERIGKQIAEARKKKGISQANLAELTNTSYAHISRIELGKHSVGIEVLDRICKPLDLKIELVEIEYKEI